jgi:hypothetical protein
MIWSDSKIVKSNLRLRFRQSPQQPGFGNVKYAEGVMVFTMQKGGLMYEASVGGQQFKFTKIKALLLS